MTVETARQFSIVKTVVSEHSAEEFADVVWTFRGANPVNAISQVIVSTTNKKIFVRYTEQFLRLVCINLVSHTLL